MIKLVLLLFFSSSLFAAPKSVEVWFISNSKATSLIRFLNKSHFTFGPQISALACQQVGDYCFDPQVGLYKSETPITEDGQEKIVSQKNENKAGPNIPTASGAVDRDMISCDPKNYFDIFCGKAQKNKAVKSKLDLWIDTSSSMREFDPTDSSGSCHRKMLVQQLDQTCPFNQSLNVMTFDTSIRQAGAMDTLCNNQGLNDFKRLIDWIERSDADQLVIITDIYENSKEFATYIESKNGVFKGDRVPLTAKMLLDNLAHLVSECK